MLHIIALYISIFTAQAEGLQSYNIDREAITISGVSSGGYMAVQMQVAHSKLFRGAAPVAGGSYWCAQGSSSKAQSRCMSFANTDVEESVAEAKRLEAEGLIDPLSELAKQSIYVYASPSDYVISPRNSDKLIDFYQAFREVETVEYERSIATGHGFPTLDYGSFCMTGGSPWLLDCDFDLAGTLLRKMYGPLDERTLLIEDRLQEFSQSDFATEENALYEKGWVYVPESCKQGEQCRLHMALHGCQMNPDFIEDQFARYAGYNEWAESNGIIVLYPQAAKVSGPNPYGCWDWFGFTSSDYVNKKGLQIDALYKMIKKVSGQ